MDRKINRRTLLKGTAALFGGATVPLSPNLAALARISETGASLAGQQTMTWYGLDPEWGAGINGCPIDPLENHSHSHACHACNACHKHAANKLFPSVAAADANRAHLGCKCKVIEAGELPTDVWEALFGPAGASRAPAGRSPLGLGW